MIKAPPGVDGKPQWADWEREFPQDLWCSTHGGGLHTSEYPCFIHSNWDRTIQPRCDSYEQDAAKHGIFNPRDLPNDTADPCEACSSNYVRHHSCRSIKRLKYSHCYTRDSKEPSFMTIHCHHGEPSSSDSRLHNSHACKSGIIISTIPNCSNTNTIY